MEITKREIIVSIAIVCVMLVFGLLIQQSIRTSITNQNKEYEHAIQIEDSDTFEYAMRTNIGNAFVYGKLVAVNPVVNDELGGEWMWIKKVEEKYTMHTRTVIVKEGKQTRTKIEHYWTWDRVGAKSWHSKNVNFLGKEFPYEIITNIGYGYIRTDTYGDTRYRWYASKVEHEGTIYTKLVDGTITKAEFHEGKTVKETFDSMVKSSTVYIVAFWIFWGLLTAVLCIIFYSFKNKWLN